MPRDLRSRRQLFELGQRKTAGPSDQTGNRKAPVGKFILGEALVIGIARFGRPVGAEFDREVGLGVLPCERGPAGDDLLHKAGDRFGAFEESSELEVIRKPVAAAQHQAADAAGSADKKATAAQLPQISHVLLRRHTSL
jgi:hypothetical protein